MAEVLSQCRGKTRFEQFKRGLARNDMVREIQRCDRHMSRIFERFMVSDLGICSLGGFWGADFSLIPTGQAAMVMDIRFQQLFAERAQSTSVSVPQVVPMPMPVLPSPSSPLPVPMSMPVPMPMPTPAPPINITEPQATLPYPMSFPQQPQMSEPSTRPNSHVRQTSAGSSSVLFVLVYTPFLSCPDVKLGRIPTPSGRKSSSDATPS